jgi:hypothetical protein
MAKQHVLITAVALVSTAVGGAAVNAEKAADVCGLLKPAEIQALAGAAKIGAGKASSSPELGARACEYQWGTGGNVQSGKTFFNFSVTPLAKAFPGLDPSTIKQGLLMSAKQGNANAGELPGVGDGAVFESDAPIRMKTTALAKGNMLVVTYESVNARTKKDQVAALLKTAVGRL